MHVSLSSPAVVVLVCEALFSAFGHSDEPTSIFLLCVAREGDSPCVYGQRGEERRKECAKARGEKSVSFRGAILYFVSQSVSSANKTARCPLLSTRRRALSQRGIATLVDVDGSPGAHDHTRRDTFRGEKGPSDPSCTIFRRSGETTERSKENRRGHSRRIADSKIATKYRPNKLKSAVSSYIVRTELYSYFIIVFARGSLSLRVRVHPPARFHELIFIRGISL